MSKKSETDTPAGNPGKIVVDDHIPLPNSRTSAQFYTSYITALLQVGQSTFMAGAKKATAQSVCSRWNKEHHGHKVKSRLWTENGVVGVRIWRV